ncbi:MAG TPA: nuclear transport factor 2 family protein [Pyrinomonadaceae bacterium]
MRYFATRLPAALLTFVVGVASANIAAHLWAGTPDERAVLAVEREYLRAHVERDVAALERVLADDFRMFGGKVTKERRLAWLSNPFFDITSLKTDGVNVAVSGRDAWVTGTAKMSFSLRGREVTTPRYGFTRHYEKRGGRWQLVSCEFGLPW